MTIKTSRVIFRNVPKYMNEKELVKSIKERVSSEITDIKIPKTASGTSRQIAFVGVPSVDNAQEIIDAFDNTYINTSRVVVSYALNPRSSKLPKAWSKYTPGSSAYINSIDKMSKEKKRKRAEVLEKNTHEALKENTYEALEENIHETSKTVLITNFPYNAQHKEIQDYLNSFGTISSIRLCQSQKSLKSLGRAIVSFKFLDEAVEAVKKLNRSIFQGRLLEAKYLHPDLDKVKEEKFIRTDVQEWKKKQNNIKIWNLLYVSGNSALDAYSHISSTEKSKLIACHTNDSVAASVAKVETSIVEVTKNWLKEQNIKPDCFIKEGFTPLSSVDVRNLNDEKSKSCFFIKHINPSLPESELKSLFSKFGPIIKFSVSPSKTIAIVHYIHEKDAKKAYLSTAYSKIGNLPLFLEWAPNNIFDSENSVQAETRPTSPLLGEKETKSSIKKQKVALLSYLLISDYDDIDLVKVFGRFPGYINVTTQSFHHYQVKVANTTKGLKESSIITFSSKDAAKHAIENYKNYIKLDVPLKITLCSNEEKLFAELKLINCTLYQCKKLLIRNLAFQVTKEDLYKLFMNYGNVISIRLPKNATSNIRGFAFIQFSTFVEAHNALENLQHTHLYGRRLVMEFAKE